MVGDTVVSDGVEFVVIWDGGEGLIADRPTKPNVFWTPPKRIYNKKSEFWTRPRGPVSPVDKAQESEESSALVLYDGREDRDVERRGGSGECEGREEESVREEGLL